MSSEAALPRRIVKETQRLLSEPAPGISATPYRDNLRYFNIIIAGPTGSPYETGIFKLELFLPEQYPMESPKVRFLTKIYHPNIDKLGRICLDILKDKWSPALQIRTVLLSIQALLSAPKCAAATRRGGRPPRRAAPPPRRRAACPPPALPLRSPPPARARAQPRRPARERRRRDVEEERKSSDKECGGVDEEVRGRAPGLVRGDAATTGRAAPFTYGMRVLSKIRNFIALPL